MIRRLATANLATLLISVSALAQATQPSDPVMRELIDRIAKREAKLSECLSRSSVRLRERTVQKSDTSDSTYAAAWITQREPGFIRETRIGFRDPDQPDSWDVENIDWIHIQSAQIHLIADDKDICFIRMKQRMDDGELAGVQAASDESLKRRDRFAAYDPAGRVVGEPEKRLSELLRDNASAHLTEDQKNIEGTLCRAVVVKAKSGSYRYWVSATDGSVYEMQVDRDAHDDYYGKPLWQSNLSAQQIAEAKVPDDELLSLSLRETQTFSDFREIAPGIRYPFRQDRTLHRQGRDWHTETDTNKWIVELELLKGPLPEESRTLNIPNGTVVDGAAHDGKPREWRDGKIAVTSGSSSPTSDRSR